MAKHKYIETPAKLWELFEAYRKEVKDNPRIQVEYVGRNGDKVKTPIERPLSVEGFKCYCYEHVGTIDHYWKNTEGKYDEFCPIISHVREHIRLEQIDGGMTGFYNSNLTARLNSLSDKSETKTTASIKLLNIDPIADNPDNGTP